MCNKLKVLLLLALILSGCTHYRKDGPPPFPVDVSKIHNAVPRYEPKSRLGNRPVYYVKGERYYVMETSRGYCERGIASWYGMLFHKRSTSSGEKFSTLAMTAAHKSLPLPTYVQVTNLENGKRVIVKVNDRGPFHENRIIDLSFVAAVKLGIFPKGTAMVEVEAIDPRAYWRNRNHKLPRKHITSKPRTFIEMGTFNNRKSAVEMARHMKNMPLPPQVYASRENGHIIYRVCIGPAKSAKHADKLLAILHKKGYLNAEIIIDA